MKPKDVKEELKCVSGFSVSDYSVVRPVTNALKESQSNSTAKEQDGLVPQCLNDKAFLGSIMPRCRSKEHLAAKTEIN